MASQPPSLVQTPPNQIQLYSNPVQFDMKSQWERHNRKEDLEAHKRSLERQKSEGTVDSQFSTGQDNMNYYSSQPVMHASNTHQPFHPQFSVPPPPLGWIPTEMIQHVQSFQPMQNQTSSIIHWNPNPAQWNQHTAQWNLIATPQDPNTAQQNPNAAQWNPNTAQQNPNAAQWNPNTAQQNPNAAQWNPNTVQQNPNAAQQNPNAAQWNPSTVQQNPNTAQWNPNTVQQNPNAAQWNPNTVQQNPNAAHWNPNTAQQNPNAAQWNPNAAHWNPNTVQQNPNAAHWNPNTAQWNPNTVQQNPNAAQQNPNAAQWNPSTVQQNPNAAQWNPNTAQQNPNAAQWNPNTAQQNPNTVQQNPNTVQQNPNAAHWNPNTAQQNPNAAHWNSNTAQQNPNAAQWNPNTVQQNPNTAHWNSNTAYPNQNPNWNNENAIGRSQHHGPMNSVQNQNIATIDDREQSVCYPTPTMTPSVNYSDSGCFSPPHTGHMMNTMEETHRASHPRKKNQNEVTDRATKAVVISEMQSENCEILKRISELFLTRVETVVVDISICPECKIKSVDNSNAKTSDNEAKRSPTNVKDCEQCKPIVQHPQLALAHISPNIVQNDTYVSHTSKEAHSTSARSYASVVDSNAIEVVKRAPCGVKPLTKQQEAPTKHFVSTPAQPPVTSLPISIQENPTSTNTEVATIDLPSFSQQPEETPIHTEIIQENQLKMLSQRSIGRLNRRLRKLEQKENESTQPEEPSEPEPPVPKKTKKKGRGSAERTRLRKLGMNPNSSQNVPSQDAVLNEDSAPNTSNQADEPNIVEDLESAEVVEQTETSVPATSVERTNNVAISLENSDVTTGPLLSVQTTASQDASISTPHSTISKDVSDHTDATSPQGSNIVDGEAIVEATSNQVDEPSLAEDLESVEVEQVETSTSTAISVERSNNVAPSSESSDVTTVPLPITDLTACQDDSISATPYSVISQDVSHISEATSSQITNVVEATNVQSDDRVDSVISARKFVVSGAEFKRILHQRYTPRNSSRPVLSRKRRRNNIPAPTVFNGKETANSTIHVELTEQQVEELEQRQTIAEKRVFEIEETANANDETASTSEPQIQTASLTPDPMIAKFLEVSKKEPDTAQLRTLPSKKDVFDDHPELKEKRNKLQEERIKILDLMEVRGKKRPEFFFPLNASSFAAFRDLGSQLLTEEERKQAVKLAHQEMMIIHQVVQRPNRDSQLPRDCHKFLAIGVEYQNLMHTIRYALYGLHERGTKIPLCDSDHTGLLKKILDYWMERPIINDVHIDVVVSYLESKMKKYKKAKTPKSKTLFPFFHTMKYLWHQSTCEDVIFFIANPLGEKEDAERDWQYYEMVNEMATVFCTNKFCYTLPTSRQLPKEVCKLIPSAECYGKLCDYLKAQVDLRYYLKGSEEIKELLETLPESHQKMYEDSKKVTTTLNWSSELTFQYLEKLLQALETNFEESERTKLLGGFYKFLLRIESSVIIQDCYIYLKIYQMRPSNLTLDDHDKLLSLWFT